jgi:PGAP1-like protein
MKKNKGQFFLFLLILSLPGCIHRRHVDRQKLHIDIPSTNALTYTHDAPPITIWVHGTLIMYTPSYHKIFGKQECMLPVDAFPEGHHFREIAETIAHHDPEHFPLEEFYIFGWSGKLRQQEREKAAAVLHEEIIKLRDAYEKKYGCTPTIRIIAHSHGGNVALSMAKLKDHQHPLIKSLILLACPVQERTKHLICTPMFNHVYSLYSSFDLVQIIAPQIRRLCTKYECPHKHHKYHYTFMPFSNRIFPTYSHLTQAKVKINDLPISHTKFSSTKFVALLPTILQKLDSWHEETLANNTISKHKLLCVYNK